jgi:hypothetical protein
MLSVRKKVENIHMAQLLGLIHAGKQSGYVMVQNIIQKLIIKPQVAELLLLLLLLLLLFFQAIVVIIRHIFFAAQSLI